MSSDAKPIGWLGDSLDRLRRFSQSVRREVGYELGLVQAGRPPTDWRPMAVVGPGTVEIRVHADGEYRVFYVAKFEDAVYVLHIFAKKTRKSPSLDIELARKRYRELIERKK